MASSRVSEARPGLLSSAWGPQQTAVARYDDFIPIMLGGAQTLLNGFFTMSRRDSAWLVLTVILLGGAWLLWPILFSLKVDGTTSMSWAAVWTPLWVADGIGVMFFLVLVSWGRLRPPPGWEGEWRDPYPVSLRVLALAKWVLLLVFQVLLVCRLDGHISDSWEMILSPLIAWVCLRALGGLFRLHLQTKRLFAGKAIAAVKVLGESLLLLLQLLFLIWRLDGEVDWGWWVVFVPAWLLYAGRLFSWCLNKALAFYLANEIKELENCSEEERKRMIEASLLMDNAKYSRHMFSGSLVMTVLAVFLIAGAKFSAFVVFIPQFFSAGWFIIVASCLICCTRHQVQFFLLAVERRRKGGKGVRMDVEVYAAWCGRVLGREVPINSTCGPDAF